MRALDEYRLPESTSRVVTAGFSFRRGASCHTRGGIGSREPPRAMALPAHERERQAVLANPTRFGLAISSVTGWHVGPLHHGSALMDPDFSTGLWRSRPDSDWRSLP